MVTSAEELGDALIEEWCSSKMQGKPARQLAQLKLETSCRMALVKVGGRYKGLSWVSAGY